ncbi:MAG: hypothetical protein DI556_13570 [Rhodovulum sulfidophilum]|uniref:Uncharacterized protein n=1 Tax=Rhodovulum sulfidophilum TaxID=35806 RepID=A0A2W5N982_RHOSU|nr:MAG: hypothetical protein DI556_13570 [Rhodovulum sulfidophilum]
MAYANPESKRPISFDWDEDDVELFEDVSPAPARPRAAKATNAPARRNRRSGHVAPAPDTAPAEKVRRREPCKRCAAEARAKERELPGLSKKDRISAPAEMNPAGRYLLAIFSPRMVGIAIVLMLATSFVKGVTG